MEKPYITPGGNLPSIWEPLLYKVLQAFSRCRCALPKFQSCISPPIVATVQLGVLVLP